MFDRIDVIEDPREDTETVHCHAEDDEHATGECIRPFPHTGKHMNARGFRYVT